MRLPVTPSPTTSPPTSEGVRLGPRSPGTQALSDRADDAECIIRTRAAPVVPAQRGKLTHTPAPSVIFSVLRIADIAGPGSAGKLSAPNVGNPTELIANFRVAS